jgi:prepilin-type N-terminal cleavage/methylation domain-containing protein
VQTLTDVTASTHAAELKAMTPQHPPTPRATGFTLVELTAVITITAIMAAIAAVKFGAATSRYRVDRAARQIAMDLATARTEACTTSRSRSVAFDASTDQYTISSTGGPLSNTTVHLSNTGYTVDLTSASFNSGSTVTFNGYGSPSAGGTVTIRSGPYEKIITLDASSAKASHRAHTKKSSHSTPQAPKHRKDR